MARHVVHLQAHDAQPGLCDALSQVVDRNVGGGSNQHLALPHLGQLRECKG